MIQEKQSKKCVPLVVAVGQGPDLFYAAGGLKTRKEVEGMEADGSHVLWFELEEIEREVEPPWGWEST